jgi:hypothetical protein
MTRFYALVVAMLVSISVTAQAQLPPWATEIQNTYMNQVIKINSQRSSTGSLLGWRPAEIAANGNYASALGSIDIKYNLTEATVVGVTFFRSDVNIFVKLNDGTLAVTTGIGEPGKDEIVSNRFDRAFITAAAAKAERERYAANASVRIWYDTTLNTVRAGETGSWSVRCQDDRIDDSRSCLILSQSPNKLGVTVVKGGAGVTIGFAQAYPASENAVRVDSQTAVKWQEATVTAQILVTQRTALAQMLSGRKYLARWFEWPSQKEIIYEGSLSGFREAYEWAQATVAAYPQNPAFPALKISNGLTPGGLAIAP